MIVLLLITITLTGLLVSGVNLYHAKDELEDLIRSGRNGVLLKIAKHNLLQENARMAIFIVALSALLWKDDRLMGYMAALAAVNLWFTWRDYVLRREVRRMR